MKDRVHYPCWVFYDPHPVQVRKCDSQTAWHFLRRHKWKKIAPTRVGVQLRKLLEDLGFDEDTAYEYVLERNVRGDGVLDQPVFVRILRGEASAMMMTPSALEQLSDAYAVPIDYFYRKDISAPPTVFGHKPRRVSAQKLCRPVPPEDAVIYRLAKASGELAHVPTPNSEAAYFAAVRGDVPTRLYHVLYTLNEGEQHRAHVIASSKFNAVSALRQKYPDVVILEASSQKLREGIVIENY